MYTKATTTAPQHFVAHRTATYMAFTGSSAKCRSSKTIALHAVSLQKRQCVNRSLDSPIVFGKVKLFYILQCLFIDMIALACISLIRAWNRWLQIHQPLTALIECCSQRKGLTLPASAAWHTPGSNATNAHTLFSHRHRHRSRNRNRGHRCPGL